MPRSAAKKKPSGKSKKGGVKKPARTFFSVGTCLKIVWFFSLLCLLSFSIAMVGYIIFFRTVEAAERGYEQAGGEYDHKPNQAEVMHNPHFATAASEAIPVVVIIIDDMGFDRQVGEAIIELDLELSFSFLPYAPFTKELEQSVYQKGRSILLHLPLEPKSSEWDPGRGALYLKDDYQVKKRSFETALLRVPHATGVNNHMGSRFTENRNGMEELISLVSEQELYFIDSFTTPESTGMAVAREMKVPTSRRHIFLDNVQSRAAICLQLEKLVELASRQDHAIGIGHPYPETLEALSSCGLDILEPVSLIGVDKVVH